MLFRSQVEDDSVGEVIERNVVVEELLASVDHFDVVELVLFHGLKNRDLDFHAAEVEFGCLIRIHALELTTIRDSIVECRGLAATYVRRTNLDVSGIFAQELLIVDVGLEEECLQGKSEKRQMSCHIAGDSLEHRAWRTLWPEIFCH